MARKTTPLSPTEVKSAKQKDKACKLIDGDGLSLRVKPNGTKSWLFDYYTPFTKKRTSISFGSYPEVSLAQARQRRLEARELVAQDIDPKEHKEEQHRASSESLSRLPPPLAFNERFVGIFAVTNIHNAPVFTNNDRDLIEGFSC